jgi:hypothetical protein
MNRSREIIEIFNDVVKATADGCTIVVSSRNGETHEMECPEINYVFGNSQYVKDHLDELSKTPKGNDMKFPLIALFCPFEERRNNPEYFSKATVNVLIACPTSKEWSNEERLERSFRNILRPIYNRLLEALKEDGRIDFGYEEVIRHKYSENYSYGRYGAHTDTGEQVSEPIDAINISNLELTITNQTCR